MDLYPLKSFSLQSRDCFFFLSETVAKSFKSFHLNGVSSERKTHSTGVLKVYEETPWIINTLRYLYIFLFVFTELVHSIFIETESNDKTDPFTKETIFLLFNLRGV